MEKAHASNKQILRTFFAHSMRYPGALIAISFFLIGGSTLEIIIPLYFKELLDTIAATDIASEGVAEVLIGILGTIVGVSLISWVMRRGSHFIFVAFQARLLSDLSRSAFNYLIGHSYDFFVRNFAGSLVRKVTKLSRSYEVFSDQIYYNILPLCIGTIGILVVLFNRHILLGGVLLVWLVIFVTLFLGVARWKQRFNVAMAERDTEQVAVLADIVTNETNVKLFAAREGEEGRFGGATEKLRKATALSWNIEEVVNATMGLLMLIIQVVLLYVAIRLWQRGLLTIGDFALIQAYLIALFERLWNLGASIRRSYEAFADAGEIVAIMETPYEVADRPGARPLVVPKGAITLRNVSFNYRKTRRVLEDFSLSITPGEKVALVGPSGAGKSTIVKLLLRLYDIDGGLITIDGQNIAHHTQESLRRSIALVPQDPILFHRTLMENIRYGKPDATEAEVMEAAKRAHCHEFINTFSEGYQTYVGERGVKLSGGERQRVAIARAMLKDAPILILDEATSSLDSESERLIQDALVTLMRGKTVIVIAHRLSTVRSVDRIIVMEGGKVVTTGTHDTLLAEGGLYARLWDIQAGGFLTIEERRERTDMLLSGEDASSSIPPPSSQADLAPKEGGATRPERGAKSP